MGLASEAAIDSVMGAFGFGNIQQQQQEQQQQQQQELEALGERQLNSGSFALTSISAMSVTGVERALDSPLQSLTGLTRGMSSLCERSDRQAEALSRSPAASGGEGRSRAATRGEGRGRKDKYSKMPRAQVYDGVIWPAHTQRLDADVCASHMSAY